MEFGWSDEDLTFRKELRAFLASDLAETWTGEARQLGSAANVEHSFSFARSLAERGWLTRHWPEEHGGAGASPWQHLVMAEEMWSIGEPRGPQYMNVNWIGPSIMAHGTEAQKQLHLPRIARGDVIWCQGFSEPDAGSDLASLRTRAVRDGNDYVVNGRKVWTSYAASAEFCYLLVRTNADAERHRGISVLLVPTDTDGFEINPIPAVVGDHAFHELVFTDMRVPVECRLGDEDQGWSVVREALAFERVGAPRYARAAFILDELVDWAREHEVELSLSLLDRIGQARAACEAARLLAYRVIDERSLGLPPSPNVYLARAAMVQAERAVGAVAGELMADEGLIYGSIADEQLRKSMVAGVAAGTYEMQLNMIAQLALKLPKGR
jgi:alkylation response protein AidB-like acyl-CoA dehydrogenase